MNDLIITNYERHHRRAVSDLLFYSHYTQIHLDWQDAESWINSQEGITRLAWKENKLVALMSASPSLNGASWMRVVGLNHVTDLMSVLRPLWTTFADVLRSEGIVLIGWLLIENWQEGLLSQLGFSYQDAIITLQRNGYDIPAHTHLPGLRVRPAENKDVPSMEQVDHTAFLPPWQNSREDILQGRKVAASSTVAEYEGRIVGFQISTVYQGNGHLARLAVHPDMQGKGVGGSLLSELITYFLRRRVRTLTVNTQMSNVRSQHLYQRFGFSRNFYDMPVWTTHL